MIIMSYEIIRTEIRTVKDLKNYIKFLRGINGTEVEGPLKLFGIVNLERIKHRINKIEGITFHGWLDSAELDFGKQYNKLIYDKTIAEIYSVKDGENNKIMVALVSLDNEFDRGNYIRDCLVIVRVQEAEYAVIISWNGSHPMELGAVRSVPDKFGSVILTFKNKTEV